MGEVFPHLHANVQLKLWHPLKDSQDLEWEKHPHLLQSQWQEGIQGPMLLAQEQVLSPVVYHHQDQLKEPRLLLHQWQQPHQDIQGMLIQGEF